MAGPFTPNSFATPDGPRPNAGSTPVRGAFSTALVSDEKSLSISLVIGLSILFHFLVIGLAALIIFILSFFGFFRFPLIQPKINDVEFQLIDAPDEKPRNPNTKNRAEHNSRSGGEKIKNVREAQTMRRSGAPRPKSAPAQQQTRQKPNPQPQQNRPVPVTKPRQSQQPSRQAPQRQTQQQQTQQPPRRTTTTRTAPSRTRVAAIPNPLAPVRVPDAKGPVGDTGPVVRGPAGGGRSGSGSASGSSSALGPATAPGQFSGGGRPSSGGGPSGEGGRGRFTQYGSPGGGGGRAGIDAKAEPDFGPNIAELQRRIRRNWRPPDDRADKTVILKFSVSRDGRLLSITTKRSSGFTDADSAARQAVENAAPFRPLPAEYARNSIDVEFTFDYNVYKNGGGGRMR